MQLVATYNNDLVQVWVQHLIMIISYGGMALFPSQVNCLISDPIVQHSTVICNQSKAVWVMLGR